MVARILGFGVKEKRLSAMASTRLPKGWCRADARIDEEDSPISCGEFFDKLLTFSYIQLISKQVVITLSLK